MEIKINLIPEWRKEEAAAARNFKIILMIGVASLSTLILFFAFLLGLYVVLNINMDSALNATNMEGSAEQQEKIKEYDETFKDINDKTNSIIRLEKDQLYWSNLFQKLSDNISPQIEITDLATKDFSVFLSGKAGNRESLVGFKEKIEKETCFFEVNLPLSNLVSPENIAFQMDFKIDSKCLQKR